ncbi:homeobox and leucine zipper encoding b [Cebidichthys violaceus]|uniref:homeobox and leucine zipper encoding b n=1 Tax=Cebidichthys violaceus TaxID=271503 RepID=UPI0035CA72D4
MRKMRQKAGEGLPHLRQETPNAPEMNAARVAFRLNQSSVLCLPLVSDSQRLIWVSSNEFNLQLDVAAKLDEAFSRFPYLTQTQTTALAQRCSLHPDQVKVWFMAQRLRYGISWDYKDIPSVRSKVMTGRGKEESRNRKRAKVKEDGGENKNCKREVEEPGEKKAGEVREEQGASEGRMTGENARATERSDIKVKPEQPVKKDKDREGEEDKRNAQKKRKRTTATDKMGKKRVKQDVVERAEGGEIRSEGAERESQIYTQEETTHFTRKKKKKKKKAKADKRSPPGQEWPARSFVAPGENNLVADGSPTVTQQQGSHEVHTRTLPKRVRFKTKTRTQLEMMKAAFSNCQYPGVEDYTRMATGINVPRYLLVQWFGDMRYYIKKSRPGWLTQEQYSRALANINYRQYLKALVKMESCIEGESVPAPPGEK